MKHCTWLRLIAGNLGLIALGGCGLNTFADSNDSPVINALKANGLDTKQLPTNSQGLPIVTVGTGSTVLLECQATDPNHDPLTFTWNIASGSGDQPQNFATFSATNEGLSTLSVTVRDDRNGVTTKALVIQAVALGVNQPPTASLDPAQFNIAPGATRSITCNATDPNTGDKLTYYFSASRGTLVQDANDHSKPTATYTAPAVVGDGKDTIFCVVTDGNGSYVTAVSQVTVQ